MNRRDFVKAVAGLCVALQIPFSSKTRRFRQVLTFSRGEEIFSIEDYRLLSTKQEGNRIVYEFRGVAILHSGILIKMKLLDPNGNVIVQEDQNTPVVSNDIIKSYYHCHTGICI